MHEIVAIMQVRTYKSMYVSQVLAFQNSHPDANIFLDFQSVKFRLEWDIRQRISQNHHGPNSPFMDTCAMRLKSLGLHMCKREAKVSLYFLCHNVEKFTGPFANVKGRRLLLGQQKLLSFVVVVVVVLTNDC